MMPKVTVIIPVLNANAYLTEALASLELQTMCDFEVLLWDNGSTDGTVENAREWIPSRLPGRVVSDCPLPLHECLARMVVEARTELIARMDGDDISLPERFALQVAALERDPELVAIGGQLRRIDAGGNPIPGFPHMPEKFHEILSHQLYASPMPHAAVMFRRSALLEAGNYRIPMPVEDMELWFRLAFRGTLANLTDVIYEYRVVETGVTLTFQGEGRHLEAVMRCLASEVPKSFEVPENVFGALLQKRARLAFPHLRRISKVIARRSNTSESKVVMSADFQRNCRCLTSKWDIVSKAVYFWWGRDRSRSVAGQMIEKLGFLPGFRLVRDMLREPRQRMVLRRWISAHERRGCTIESFDVRGRSEWVDDVRLGRGVSLEKEVTFAFPPDGEPCPGLSIGDRVFIGRNTFLSAYDTVTIGDDVLIGAYCYVASNNHRLATRAVSIGQQGYDLAPVEICSGAWIGAHAVILPGVTVGEGAVVAAGAVVTRDIPPFEIWGGVPARLIKTRP